MKYLHWICMIFYHADGLNTLSYKIQQLYCLVWEKVVKTCLINFMRSSNWCKNLAEISASSWKVSSSPWAHGAQVTSGSLCALGGIHLQHPQAEQGTLSPVLSLVSLFLLHVLTNMNCNAEGRKGKDLKSQWKTVTKFHWTGNDCIWVDQFYLVSALCVSTLCQH